MARRRSRSTASPVLPPPLRHLVRACEIECPSGHAEALSALVALALHKVPARGIFDPGTRDEPELDSAVEAIGQEHLDLAQARRLWRKTLKAAGLPPRTRDDLESASLQVQMASDTSYFYAGLAFGLTFGYYSRFT